MENKGTMKGRKVRKCVWRYIKDDLYQTGCGDSIYCIDEKLNLCPLCWKIIEVLK